MKHLHNDIKFLSISEQQKDGSHFTPFRMNNPPQAVSPDRELFTLKTVILV